MEKKFLTSENGKVYYLKWEAEAPRCAVVISHGMVEHPARYDAFARYLNENNITVYGIYHIGHGEDALHLGHMDDGDFGRCVDNLHVLVTLAKEETCLPVILLGHSMGSFMSQLYVTKYHDIDALILFGSTKAAPIAKIGATVAKVLHAFSRDKTAPSFFMNAMAFGSYNKKFSEHRSVFDWLSRDCKEVKKYVDDPLCGAICSIGFFKNLTGAMAEMGKADLIKNVDTSLPIYIQGGSMDPVSNYGRGLLALKKQYDDLGVKRVDFTMYDGARHEILNETNRCEVYENTLAFINSVI